MDQTDAVCLDEAAMLDADDRTDPESSEATSQDQNLDVSLEAVENANMEVEDVGRGIELVDDFIRNFCVRHGMFATLNAFEAEWMDLSDRNGLPEERRNVPDQYRLNLSLEEEIDRLQEELRAANLRADSAKSNALRLQKERDAHRLHYKRVAQEKHTLTEEIKRLKKQCNAYEPRIRDLQRKCEQQLKERAIICLEKEKIQQKLEAVETLVAEKDSQKDDTVVISRGEKRQTESTVGRPRARESDAVQWKRIQVQDFTTSTILKRGRCEMQGHTLSVSNLALHPTKPLVASASDDRTWKLWQFVDGELIMTGEGHTDWISGIDFHPRGNGLATGSGDGTVKLWDFEEKKCVKTFIENHAIWAVKFHETGQMMATASLDHITRLWDLPSEKCTSVLRGHLDSVNQVAWKPKCSVLCTASSDRTVALWDARLGRSLATFCGHTNSCNHCCFANDGHLIASCDTDGDIRVWDVRTMREIITMTLSRCPANQCIFDKSDKVLSVAYDDGFVRCCDPLSGNMFHEFVAHNGGALSILCKADNTAILTSGSDHLIKYWSAENA